MLASLLSAIGWSKKGLGKTFTYNIYASFATDLRNINKMNRFKITIFR